MSIDRDTNTPAAPAESSSDVKDLDQRPLTEADAAQVRGGGSTITNAWPSKLSGPSISSTSTTTPTSSP